jgi:hypothetical protein
MSGGFERRPGGADLVQHGREAGGALSPGKRTLTEQLFDSSGPPVQRKAGGAAASDPAELHRAAEAGVSGPAAPLPHADRIQASFGPEHDVSSIQAHVGGAAALATDRMGAEAYASGNSVAFGAAPSLHTAAHEAAHVMQQRSGVQLLGGVGAAGDVHEQNADGVADRVVAGQSAAGLLPRGGAGGPSAVQMRRLPTNTGAMLTDPAHPANPGANYAANSAGIKRLIQVAEAELTPPQRVQVNTATLAGQTQPQFDALPEQTRLTRRVEAIRSVRPDLTLGDPALIDTGPRPGTADTANLNTLVANANAIFDQIAGGGRDADIDQVFGHANRAVAKTKYANGKTWMNNLKASNHIVTDRSGYNDEVGLGGLTGFQTQIALSPGFIDTPGDHEAVVTMIHESMHAGNADVSDKGYIGTQVFTQLPEAVKLTNAAHFEVVPRRILGASNAYAGVTFTPAGAAAAPGAAATAPLTPLQVAVRDASEQLRTAWTMGLNLHTLYDTLYKDQTQWNTPQAGGSFRQGLPYWSKVEKLTIYQKTVLDPTAADPARRPISQIDMALSEGVTRKFVQCMVTIDGVPNDAAGANAFLAAHATPVEINAAHATPAAHRDLWIKAILRMVGPITGPEARDLRVVHELVRLNTTWGTVLQHRDPGGFPD